MKTIYAVSSGEYSDYSVHAAFEREEDAQQYADRRTTHSETFRVEDLPFYGPGEVPPVHTLYYAHIAKDPGTYRTRGEAHVSETRVEGLAPKFRPSRETPWGFTASGPDRERAIKSVKDHYMQWKAREEGIA